MTTNMEKHPSVQAAEIIKQGMDNVSEAILMVSSHLSGIEAQGVDMGYHQRKFYNAVADFCQERTTLVTAPPEDRQPSYKRFL